jgi:hypothetical protein
MTTPGRLAVLLVASILIQGFLFQNNLWNSHTSTAHEESFTAATLTGTITHTSIHASTGAAPAVQVSVYVEALCIDSKNFFNKQLIPAYDQLGPKVMNLQVVVYGNAEIDLKTKTLKCQHGGAECDANSYDQCAAAIYPYSDRYLPYMSCLFNDLPMGKRSEPFPAAIFASCARHAALDAHTLQQCHDDADRVWELQKHAAVMTPAQHDHVPWVELNGNYMDEEQNDLLASVCQLYTASGGSHPACSNTEPVSVLVA